MFLPARGFRPEAVYYWNKIRDKISFSEMDPEIIVPIILPLSVYAYDDDDVSSISVVTIRYRLEVKQSYDFKMWIVVADNKYVVDYDFDFNKNKEYTI